MPKYELPYDPSTMPRNLEHLIYAKKGHVPYLAINPPEVRKAPHSPVGNFLPLRRGPGGRGPAPGRCPPPRWGLPVSEIGVP